MSATYLSYAEHISPASLVNHLWIYIPWKFHTREVESNRIADRGSYQPHRWRLSRERMVTLVPLWKDSSSKKGKFIANWNVEENEDLPYLCGTWYVDIHAQADLLMQGYSSGALQAAFHFWRSRTDKIYSMSWAICWGGFFVDVNTWDQMGHLNPQASQLWHCRGMIGCWEIG